MLRFLWLPLILLLVGAGPESEPTPGPLDWAIGHWEGTRRDIGDGEKAVMDLIVERLPGGPGQIERLAVETDGDAYVGVTVRMPDPDTGQWFMIYVNDVRPKLARLLATFDGDRVVWNSVTAKPPRGSRLVAERLGPDHWRRTQQFTRDGGETWQDMFVDELRRAD